AEPQAVLNRAEIVSGAGPQLAGRQAAQGIDAGRDLALLVGGDRRLPLDFGHGRLRMKFSPESKYHPGNIYAIILPGQFSKVDRRRQATRSPRGSTRVKTASRRPAGRNAGGTGRPNPRAYRP